MSEYTFNAELARDNLVKGVAELAKKQGFNKVVIGISGGKDSTVCAAICARALGAENVYGVMMPDGEQKDISDSIEVCSVLGINRKKARTLQPKLPVRVKPVFYDMGRYTTLFFEVDEEE